MLVYFITSSDFTKISNMFNMTMLILLFSIILIIPIQTYAISPPDAPNQPKVTAGNGDTYILWNTPNDGGSQIIDYIIYVDYNDGNSWQIYDDGVSDITSWNPDDTWPLAEPHGVKIAAVNVVGEGPASTHVDYTRHVSPDPPTINDASAEYLSIMLVLTPPVYDGSGLIGYVVECSEDGGITWIICKQTEGSSPIVQVKNLRSGVDYNVRISAVSIEGTGSPVELSGTLAPTCDQNLPHDPCPPDAPLITEVTASDGLVNLSWSAVPDFPDDPIIGYVVQYSDDGENWVVVDDGESNTETSNIKTSTTIHNLTNGVEYYFKVAGKTQTTGVGYYVTITATPLCSECPDPPVEKKKKGGGGCDDCDAPTLGINSKSKRIVENGFTYNGKSVDAERFFTPYPLITANVGKLNTAVFKIYEDKGPENIKHFSFAFGLDTGQIISESKAMIELDIDYDRTETVTVTDPENALDSIKVSTNIENCNGNDSDTQCLIVTINHRFRAPLEFNIVGTDVWDMQRNSWQNYFNHGIDVTGQSLNPMKTMMISGPEKYEGFIEVTQNAMYSDVWTSDDGRDFVKNNHDSFKQINQEFEFIIEDGTGKDRADYKFKLKQIWDLKNAQVILAEICPRCNDEPFDKINNIFGHDITITPRSEDKELQEWINYEGIRAMYQLNPHFNHMYPGALDENRK